jgi:tetratricopeptide (TPR) repeat protein
MYLRQAGAKAFARSTHRQSATFLEEALVALRHLSETSATLEQAVDVRIALRNSLWPLGDFETGLGHLRDAERLAKKLGDQRRLGWISAYMSEHSRQTGLATDAPRFAERAQTIAEKIEDFPLRIAANYYLGTAYFASGDYRRADELFSNIVRLLWGDLFRERCGLAGFPAVMSRAFWAWALAECGKFHQGMTHAEEGVRLAEALDHPYSLTFACKAVGHFHGARGEIGRAIPFAERALAVCRDWNLTQLSPQVADVLGYLYALSGRVAEGLSLLQEALRALESMGHVQWRSPLIVHLGEAYLIAGQLNDALALATQGLTLARERGHRGSEAWELRLLGEIASRNDHPDAAAAEAHYSAAIALASELGMRPLVAHCHLGLCKLYRQTGNREQAHEPLAAATSMYREMSMQSWLQKAEAEMRQLG